MRRRVARHGNDRRARRRRLVAWQAITHGRLDETRAIGAGRRARRHTLRLGARHTTPSRCTVAERCGLGTGRTASASSAADTKREKEKGSSGISERTSERKVKKKKYVTHKRREPSRCFHNVGLLTKLLSHRSRWDTAEPSSRCLPSCHVAPKSSHSSADWWASNCRGHHSHPDKEASRTRHRSNREDNAGSCLRLPAKALRTPHCRSRCSQYCQQESLPCRWNV